MVKRARSVQVFVEGGGDGPSLKIECRMAFIKLLERAGFARARPSFAPCGSRQSAFKRFVTACRLGVDDNLLLVDSEAPVTEDSPWEHVRRREGDKWSRPAGASDDDLHFMVECMEAWIVADREALRAHYNRGDRQLQEGALPARADVEKVAKRDLFRALDHATREAGGYGKGADSFKLLAAVDLAVLRRSCPSAERFFAELERRSPPRR